MNLLSYVVVLSAVTMEILNKWWIVGKVQKKIQDLQCCFFLSWTTVYYFYTYSTEELDKCDKCLYSSQISIKIRHIMIRHLLMLYTHFVQKAKEPQFWAVWTCYAAAVAWLILLSPIHPHTLMYTQNPHFDSFSPLPSNSNFLQLFLLGSAHTHLHTSKHAHTRLTIYTFFSFTVCGGYHILCLL